MMAEVPAASGEPPASDAQGSPAAGVRRLAGNYLLLLSGEALAKLANFFAFTFLGRTLGAVRYGSLEFTLAVMVFFTLPVDLGLGVFGAREVAKDRRSAARMLVHVTLLRALLALVSLGALLVFVRGVRGSPEVKQLLAWYGLSLLGTPLLLQWFFQGQDRMHWVALASLVRYGAFAVLVFWLVDPNTPLARIGRIECAAVAAVALFCVAVVAASGDLRLREAPVSLRSTLGYLREAAPIGLTELTWAFLWYIATVLLGLMLAGASLGWFGASHRALMAVHTFVWLYFFNLLPSISRTVSGPKSELERLLGSSLRLTMWGGVWIALTVTLSAGALLGAAFGPAFSSGGPLFATLIWMIPVALASGHYRYTLIAYNRQALLFRATATAAAVVVVASLVLIPRLGALGAAAALLAGCTLELILVWAYVRRQITAIPVAPHLVKPAVSAAGALLASRILASNPVGAAAAAGVVFLLIMGVWERREIRRAVAALLPARAGRA
jgi:O-antigen/teichoic acid export membrane protein